MEQLSQMNVEKQKKISHIVIFSMDNDILCYGMLPAMNLYDFMESVSFSLNSNMLMESSKLPWNRIIRIEFNGFNNPNDLFMKSVGFI